MARDGAISISADATRAFTQLRRLEAELQKLMKKGGGAAGSGAVRPVRKINLAIEKAVAYTMEQLQADIAINTPKQTRFLVSNWKLAQGAEPSLTELRFPPPDKARQSYSVFPVVSAAEIDGSKPQWLYNPTSYASRVAQGFNASGRPIVSGGGPSWFLNVGQRFSSGVTFKAAFTRAVQEVGR